MRADAGEMVTRMSNASQVDRKFNSPMGKTGYRKAALPKRVANFFISIYWDQVTR